MVERNEMYCGAVDCNSVYWSFLIFLEFGCVVPFAFVVECQVCS